MRNTHIAGVLILLATLYPAIAASQYDPGAAQQHLRAAGQAYRDGDFDAFAKSLETARDLNPFSLATRYNLACAYARTGRIDDSFALLMELVESRVDYGMAADPDLESLHADARFAPLIERLDENMRPIGNSEHVFTVHQLGLIPEGIAIDPASGNTYFGSMRSGEIFVRDKDGNLSRFATVEHDGPLAAIGLTIDSNNSLLWAIGSSFQLTEGFDPDAPARAGVFGFNLKSGEIVRQHTVTGEDVGFNDVTVSKEGDLYLSGASLSVVRAGSDEIEVIETSTPVFGSNGVALTPDGAHLIATSYPVGIAVVELASGETRWLDAPPNTTLYGIDGLYWHEGDLVGVQNGARPWRLVRLSLDDAITAVTDVRLIEFANPDVTPTTGAIVGNTIYYVGEGPDPETMPAHFPPQMAGNSGKTIVMSAPLD